MVIIIGGSYMFRELSNQIYRLKEENKNLNEQIIYILKYDKD